jgi:hypothetical protein
VKDGRSTRSVISTERHRLRNPLPSSNNDGTVSSPPALSNLVDHAKDPLWILTADIFHLPDQRGTCTYPFRLVSRPLTFLHLLRRSWFGRAMEMGLEYRWSDRLPFALSGTVRQYRVLALRKRGHRNFSVLAFPRLAPMLYSSLLMYSGSIS